MNIRIIMCKGCGAEVRATHNARQFCSPSCAQAYRRKRKGVMDKQCKFCGKPLNRWETDYCSKECVGEAWARKRPKCLRPGCDRHVSPGKKFCSRVCWREHAHGRRKCVTCGTMYIQQNRSQGRRCLACYRERSSKINRQRQESPYRVNSAGGKRGLGPRLSVEPGEVLA